MKPDPLFKLFGQPVYAYGIFIAVGILACLLVFFAFTKKKGMTQKVQDFTFFIVIVAIAFGFLFAKLYQAFYDLIETGEWDFYGAGITVMGGLIGGAGTFLLAYFLIGKYYFKGKEKGLHIKEFNITFSVAPVCITLAHAFGRIGCLMSGCCHGALVEKTYQGSLFYHGGIWMEANSYGWCYCVPTQLYEAIFLFVLFGILTYLYFNRCNIIMHIYLIAYGMWRMFIEIFRTDNRGGFVLGLAPSQWQSIVFILGGVALIIIYLVKDIPLFFPKPEQVEATQKESVSAKKEEPVSAKKSQVKNKKKK